VAVSSICATFVLASVLLADGCNRSSWSRVSLEAFEPRSPEVVMAASPHAPLCPPAGASALKPSAATGHHRLILTWNASVPSALPEDNAVGYCLYRSQIKGAARDYANCRVCEQINPVPVMGTSCVDDLVQDSALYYYVVTAITTDERRSSSSNEIPVPIPAGNQPAKSSSTPSAPSCRGTSSSNGSVGTSP
jgi:hypothetical protein